jgi:hypothetical protein
MTVRLFHFITEGIHAALQLATVADKRQGVRSGGGVATIQQYLRARLSKPAPPPLTNLQLDSGRLLEKLVRDVIHEDCGPLIHNGWEDEQRTFDSTCRKFYRFLTQPQR